MKAIVVHQYGGSEVLKVEECPDPVPDPGEVLLRVTASRIRIGQNQQSRAAR